MAQPRQGHPLHGICENSDDLIDIRERVGFLKWENEQGYVEDRPIFHGEELIVGREPYPVPWSKPGPGESIPITITDDENHPFVSKRHFRIYSIIFDRSDPSVQPLIYCEDLESTNGTYVNGVCIGMLGRERVGHLLCHGDVIEVRPQWRFQIYQPSRKPTSEVRGHPEEIADIYKLTDRKLGSGQYGAVFLATEVATSKQIACKIVDFSTSTDQHSQVSGTSPGKISVEMPSAGDKAKLKREMFILSQLNHPHIVNMRKAFCSENTMYTFTDLAPGGDLFSYIDSNGGPLTDCHSRIIARQLILAVKYLHFKGIVHRDIKPENILIMHTNLGGRVVLTDFGFAIDAGSKGGRMLSKLGTAGYCAPEVENVELSKESYTSAADLWSLGVSIAYLLTNDAILPRDQTSHVSRWQLAELFHGFKDGSRTEAWENLSSRALRFLRRLVAVNPAERMTAEEALNHSWLTKPLSEATAIEECCARIIQFWKKREYDDVVMELPQARQSQQVESSSRGSGPKKRIPDASSSPYFSLERHLRRRGTSHRRSVLEGLSKTKSQFVATADGPKTSRLQILSTHGRDMFGKSPDTQAGEQLSVTDEISFVFTTQRPEKRWGLNKSDPASACSDSPSEAAQVGGESENSIESISRKRVRFESEDPEEKILRDDVAKNGPKWQSALDFKISILKRKMELRQGDEPAHPSLAIRSA